MLGTGAHAPTVADVAAVLGLFEPGLRLDPDISGDYRILHFGSSQTADNGLPYAVCKLEHSTLGYQRRGKWYDMADWAEDEFNRSFRLRFNDMPGCSRPRKAIPMCIGSSTSRT